MPWVGHEALTTALGDNSCGCQLIEKALKEHDPYAAQAYHEAGVEAQKKWGCPNGGFKPPETLTPSQQESLEAIGNLTGADCSECKTCPRADFYLFDSNGNPNHTAHDADRAFKARLWRDKGQLHLLVGPEPQNTLVEAIDCLDEAFMRRENYDAKKRAEKHEAELKKVQEASNPHVRERIQG